MYRVLVAALMWLMLSLPVQADEKAQDVISAQIEAFQRDDFVAAFEFASPIIQQIFRTPERFGQMVRNGYPMVWRPSEVDFLSSEVQGDELVQRVMVRDIEGAVYVLEYRMVETPDGWLINGVSLQAEEENLAALQLPF